MLWITINWEEIIIKHKKKNEEKFSWKCLSSLFSFDSVRCCHLSIFTFRAHIAMRGIIGQSMNDRHQMNENNFYFILFFFPKRKSQTIQTMGHNNQNLHIKFLFFIWQQHHNRIIFTHQNKKKKDATEFSQIKWRKVSLIAHTYQPFVRFALNYFVWKFCVFFLFFLVRRCESNKQ